jgi:hypothetical protein
MVRAIRAESSLSRYIDFGLEAAVIHDVWGPLYYIVHK